MSAWSSWYSGWGKASRTGIPNAHSGTMARSSSLPSTRTWAGPLNRAMTDMATPGAERRSPGPGPERPMMVVPGDRLTVHAVRASYAHDAAGWRESCGSVKSGRSVRWAIDKATKPEGVKR